MSAPTVKQLRTEVQGEVIEPTDEGYDAARAVQNGMIDRHPTVIVRAANMGGAIAAVDFARESGLDLAVRGGGHSVPGFGTCDGVVLDLSGMRGVRVDAAAGTARAEGGATWGDYNDATHEFGLASTGGIISTTGVGGLTLGGGIGYLSRGLGLSVDNLLSADVVTADGRFLVASERENEDLFWALRGGGGNFGVVTAFEFRLSPVSEIYGGPMFFELDDARRCLQWYREFIADAPEEFGGFPAFQIAPPLPFIPEERHGDTFLAFVSCWAGPVDEGEAIARVAPRGRAGRRRARRADALPRAQLRVRRAVPPGLQHYWKANFVTELTDDAIEAHLQHGPEVPAVNSTAHIYPINGACPSRRPVGDRLRPPRGELRDRDRGHVAGPGGQRREHRRGSATTTTRPRRTPRRAATSTSWPATTRTGSGQLRDELRPAGRGEAGVRPGQPVPPEPEHRAVAR